MNNIISLYVNIYKSYNTWELKNIIQENMIKRLLNSYDFFGDYEIINDTTSNYNIISIGNSMTISFTKTMFIKSSHIIIFV
jgi:hypothetical protein